MEACFRSHDCVPLPRPVDAESQLSQVEGMEWSELRSEFREEYVILERLLLQLSAEPKKMGGRELTGEMLALLCREYADAVHRRTGIIEELTSLPTQWQMVAKLAGERAVKLAAKEYKARLSRVASTFPVADASKWKEGGKKKEKKIHFSSFYLKKIVLAQAHQQAWNAALQVFNSESGADEDVTIAAETEPFLRQLQALTCRYETLTTLSYVI